MGLKLLAALLLVGLVHGVILNEEYWEVEVELNAGTNSFDWQVVENAFKIENITATETTNCLNDDGTPRYSYFSATVWSYYGCHVKLTVVFIKQSTIHCITIPIGDITETEELTTTFNFGNDVVVGQIVSMELVTEISENVCIFKETFWYLVDRIVTSNGCEADFEICYLRAPCPLCVVKRVGGGRVVKTFPRKTLVSVAVVALFGSQGSCTWSLTGEVFSADGCAGFFLFCFSPSTLHCEISEDPKVVGFDKQHLNVTDPCMYNAVSFIFSEFCLFRIAVKVSTEPTTGAAVVTFVQIVTNDTVIQMDKDTVMVDGVVVVVTATVQVIKHVCFVRKLGFIHITLRCGIIIKWKGRLGLFKIWAPPCFSASVFGLCGNANWDRLDDLTAPGGQSVASLHVVPDTSPTPSTLPQCNPK